MPARTVPENGERVVRTDTGETATYVDQHKDGQFEVLLDTGPKQSTTWSKHTPVEIRAGRNSPCGRCGAADHTAFYCPRDTPADG